MTRLLICIATALLTARSSHALSNCIQCGSTKLNPMTQPSYWQLTGLPNPFPATDAQNTMGYYSRNDFCENPNDPNLSGLLSSFKVACTSACITLAVNDPSLSTSTTGWIDPTNLLIVRGCWDKLTGLSQYANDATMANNLAGNCEMGKYRSFDDNGQQVDAWAFNRFCVSEKLVPKDGAFHCNSQQVQNSTNNGGCTPKFTAANVPCYECSDDDWNCKSGQCNADGQTTQDTTGLRYCKKTHTKINDEYNTVKSCSPINPFAVAGCSHYHTNQSFYTRSRIDIQADTCFCSDQDYCNGAPNVNAAGLLAIGASLLLAAHIW